MQRIFDEMRTQQPEPLTVPRVAEWCFLVTPLLLCGVFGLYLYNEFQLSCLIKCWGDHDVDKIYYIQVQVLALLRFLALSPTCACEKLRCAWRNLNVNTVCNTVADYLTLTGRVIVKMFFFLIIFLIGTVVWSYFFLSSLPLQILEALARNDEQLVQTCTRVNSNTELVPEELQLRFSSMCAERLEHINRRITNYRKVWNTIHILIQRKSITCFNSFKSS